MNELTHKLTRDLNKVEVKQAVLTHKLTTKQHKFTQAIKMGCDGCIIRKLVKS